MTETETAAHAYARTLWAARALADRIDAELTELELGNDRLTNPSWADVEDLAETVRNLRVVSDRLFNEGEHASESQ